MKLIASKENLQEFAVLWAVFCFLLNLFLLFKGQTNPYLALLAGLLLFIGFSFMRAILKPFYFIWMALAFVLGLVMSRVFLGFVFFAVLTPIGLLAKLFGKHFLDLKNQTSYWQRRNALEGNYEKQS